MDNLHSERLIMNRNVWFVLPLLLLLGACGRKHEVAQAEVTADMMAPYPSADAAVSEAPDAEESARAVMPAASRKIIYHATVRVKVDDLVRANTRMDSLTRTFGAFVSEAAETREDGQWEHKMTIRVLPNLFPTLLNKLNGLGTLESKELTTDDVTAEHADVAARLRTKRALEQRYAALLGQAKKVSEILEIEEKLGEVRGDIEATESKLKTLNDQVAYSTITLTYYQLLTLNTPDTPVISFGSRLVEAFYNGWKLLTSLVLALVTAWPLLLGGSMAVWGLRAWRMRRLQRARFSEKA